MLSTILQGCVSFRTYQQREYTQLEHELNAAGLSTRQVKNPKKAGLLNILPGIGNTYLGQWGMFAVNLITWPFSIVWGIPQAMIDAENINKKETLYWYTFGPGKQQLLSIKRESDVEHATQKETESTLKQNAEDVTQPVSAESQDQ